MQTRERTMSEALRILSVGAGTLLAIVVFAVIVFWFIEDVTQKKHAVLRNYPVIGRLRYFFEKQGEYFRQYFFVGDRDEMPLQSRHARVGLPRGEAGRRRRPHRLRLDLRHEGARRDPLRERAASRCRSGRSRPRRALTIGEGYCGAAVHRAIAREHQRHELRRHLEARGAGALARRGDRRMLDGHRRGRARAVSRRGRLRRHHADRHREVRHPRSRTGASRRSARRRSAKVVKAFEIKLSQGAKPGKGGVLPGGKVTPEIAAIRGIPQGEDSISPNRHRDAANATELLDQVAYIRELTGRPVGIKTAVGGLHFLNDIAENVLRRGLEYAPDFIVIDGGEGGSGAAPQALFDHMSLSIEEALPRAADVLYESGLKERIRLVASGKLVTSARAAWALCVGADFVNTARGFMFSLGCIQALRCHTNTCPTGITTHNPRLQRGLVVEEKYQRVANYAMGMNKDIEMIAHACGVAHPRLLARALPHRAGERASAALNMIYPYPTPTAGPKRRRPRASPQRRLGAQFIAS